MELLKKNLLWMLMVVGMVHATTARNPIVSVLTCSPGSELYSVFGHSALRVQDSLDGRFYDVVYNYGTFQFTDDFYVQFAQGRLDYFLSVSSFGEFQQMYLFDGRGIQEQYLLMTNSDLIRLSDLLMENAQPENATFRYHFFKDNCSTRVWNIIKKASSKPLTIDLDVPQCTFRSAIQTYLNYMPWGDFGIDLALGAPCDDSMQIEDRAFLPDSLLLLLSRTQYGSTPLTSRPMELIPVDAELELPLLNAPVVLSWMILVFVLASGFWMARKGKLRTVPETIFISLVSLVGCLLVFLWFFTDHDTTHQNWNLIWANPLWFYFLFRTPRTCATWERRVAMGFAALLLSLLFFVSWVPQTMHPAIWPFLLTELYILIKIMKPFWFTKHLNEKQ
jgi:hypothetical protein